MAFQKALKVNCKKLKWESRENAKEP